jgi:hypothetical protein
VEFPRIPSPFAIDSNISITSINDYLNEHEINTLEKWPYDSDIEIEMHDLNPPAARTQEG